MSHCLDVAMVFTNETFEKISSNKAYLNSSNKKKILPNFLGNELRSVSPQQRGNEGLKYFNNICQLESKTQRNNEINFPEKRIKQNNYENADLENTFVNFSADGFF